MCFVITAEKKYHMDFLFLFRIHNENSHRKQNDRRVLVLRVYTEMIIVYCIINGQTWTTTKMRQQIFCIPRRSEWIKRSSRVPIVSVPCLLILLTARKLRAFISVTLWAFTCNNFHNEKLAAYNFMLFYVWCNIGAYIQSVPLSTNYHLCHLYSVEKRWFRCVKHCAIFHLIRPVSHAYCCGYASMISRLYLETRSDDCFTSRAVLFLYLL